MQKYMVILSQVVVFSVDSELFELWSIAKRAGENKVESARRGGARDTLLGVPGLFLLKKYTPLAAGFFAPLLLGGEGSSPPSCRVFLEGEMNISAGFIFAQKIHPPGSRGSLWIYTHLTAGEIFSLKKTRLPAGDDFLQWTIASPLTAGELFSIIVSPSNSRDFFGYPAVRGVSVPPLLRAGEHPPASRGANPHNLPCW